jgi:hypothetical protein
MQERSDYRIWLLCCLLSHGLASVPQGRKCEGRKEAAAISDMTRMWQQLLI